MLAKTGARVSQLLERVYGITGRLYALEDDLPATPEMRVAVPRRLRGASTNSIGRYLVVKISQMDGTKLYLENDNWALLRFSGTEPMCVFSSRLIPRPKPKNCWRGCGNL